MFVLETKQDFDEIVLLPEEQKELILFDKNSPRTACPCHALSQYGLVSADCSGTDPEGYPLFAGTYSITGKGVRYLAYQRQCKKRALGKYLASKWIDFLALIVAIIALFISIIALNNSLPMQ